MRVLKKKPTLTFEKEKKLPPLFWDDIKNGITGFARIVHFTNHSNVYGQVDDYD
jgi:hypothetical protein